MDSPSVPKQEAYKKYFSFMERSVQFWTEARGDCRKITSVRLKSSPHSDAAESIALTIWKRMKPDDYRQLVEINRLLVSHQEIRVAELRETLGQVLEAVNVDVRDLRAIHNTPIEALTLLLNHIVKMFNERDFDAEAASDTSNPPSSRVEQMVAKAKELGLDNIDVPKDKYMSEQTKLAKIKKQILHQIKLETDKPTKVKPHTERISRRPKPKKSAAPVDNPSNKLTSTAPNEVKVPSAAKTGNSKAPSDSGSTSKSDISGASIDTSGWMVSEHKYYFGSAPPEIPKTSVTHEVYPKPVNECKMTETTSQDDETECSGNLSEQVDFAGQNLLPDGFEEKVAKVDDEASLESSEDEGGKEMIGDASTIYDWTEPEKSPSCPDNTGESLSEIRTDEAMIEGGGDNCDLMRTKEESCMSTLNDEQEVVPPPKPFSLTNVLSDDDEPRSDFLRRSESNLNHRVDVFRSSHTAGSCYWDKSGMDQDKSDSESTNQSASEEMLYPNEATPEITEGVREPNIACQQKTEDMNTKQSNADPVQPKTEEVDEGAVGLARKKTQVLVMSSSNRPNQPLSRSVIDELTAEIMKKRSSALEKRSTTSNPDMEPSCSRVIRNTEVDAKVESETVASAKSDPKESISKSTNEDVVPEAPPNNPTTEAKLRPKIVDEFTSAHDLEWSELQRDELSVEAPSSPLPVKPSDSYYSGSPGHEYSEATPSTRSKRRRRNDMMTLGVLALALGLGTLGYMSSASSGTGSIFSDAMGPTGGRALNIVESMSPLSLLSSPL